MMGVPHPVCSPDLTPCDFCFFGYAEERMKHQITTSEDDLEDKLTEASEIIGGDRFKSMFYPWMSR
jgi:hypothetical protein